MQLEAGSTARGASLDKLRDFSCHASPFGATGDQQADSALNARVTRVAIMRFEDFTQALVAQF